MDRSAIVAVVVAALGVIAVAAAAATLSTVVTDGPAGSGGGDSNQTGIIPVRDDPPETGRFDIDIPPIVQQIALVLFVLAVFAGLLYVVYNFREALSKFIAIAAILLALVLLALVLDALSGSIGTGPGSGIGTGGSGGAFFSGEGSSGARTLPTTLVAVVGIVLVAAVVTLIGATGNITGDPPDDESETPASGTVGVGEAAGRAADRIERAAPEGADVDNEVYRAWEEMTGYLDVPNPEASTPGEFATAAVAAGMDRGDVRELTRLFEEVRYGGLPAEGADREERALAVLRRIEDAYAEPADPDGRDAAAGDRRRGAGSGPDPGAG